MKLGLLKYRSSLNVGDNIQTLAVAQHVKQTDHYVERDFLNEYDGEECVVVLNGWFSDEPGNWPPSDKILPIFFGFHMSPKAASAYQKHREYFKKYEPIGCRDKGTADIFQNWGVEAYVSGCATMTFPTRKHAPKAGKVILVDVNKRYFRRPERSEYILISHDLQLGKMGHHTKNMIAADLLDYYRGVGDYVITSKIHCAMPCYAMGIPTIFCGNDDYRTDAVNMIGLPRMQFSKYRRLGVSELMFTNPDFDAVKERVSADLRRNLSERGVEITEPR